MHASTRPSRAALQRAFTLAELIVAVIVTAIVSGAVAGSLSRLVDIRARVDDRASAATRAADAADRIAMDAMTLVRDHDLLFCRVMLTDHDARGVPRDELLMVVRSLRRVRPLADGPESAEHEVQYRVVDEGSGEGTALWRREDHALDRAQDAGGLARPIVEGVVALSAQAYDGASWYDVWDSDYDGLPHALRITVTARAADAPATATARRVVSIDRAPLPVDAADEDDVEAPGEESADAPAGGESPQTQPAGDGGDAGGAGGRAGAGGGSGGGPLGGGG